MLLSSRRIVDLYSRLPFMVKVFVASRFYYDEQRALGHATLTLPERDFHLIGYIILSCGPTLAESGRRSDYLGGSL